MPPSITFRPIAIAIGAPDDQGQLVLVDGRLAAVLSHLLDSAHGEEHRGGWFVEAAFGAIGEYAQELIFANLAEAACWFERHCPHQCL